MFQDVQRNCPQQENLISTISRFSELVCQLFEIHQNSMYTKKLYDKKNIMILVDRHNCKTIEMPPEYLYKLIDTYESDFWQLAKYIYTLATKQSNIYIQDKENINEAEKLYEKVVNYSLNDPLVTIPENPELSKFLNQMLRIYCGQRLPIAKILQNPILIIPEKMRNQMIQFYQQEDVDWFLKKLIQPERMQGVHIFQYQIDLTHPLCKKFYKEVLQIQLLNIALQLCFHYPTEVQSDYQELHQLIVEHLLCSSKQLKQKATFYQPAMIGSDYLDEGIQNFRNDIIKQHNNLISYKQFIQSKLKQESEDCIPEIQLIFAQYADRAYKKELSFLQKLFVRIIGHLVIQIVPDDALNHLELQVVFREILLHLMKI